MLPYLRDHPKQHLEVLRVGGEQAGAGLDVASERAQRHGGVLAGNQMPPLLPPPAELHVHDLRQPGHKLAESAVGQGHQPVERRLRYTRVTRALHRSHTVRSQARGRCRRARRRAGRCRGNVKWLI
eukprot:4768995-Pyramimonas_sp.AAC.2